MLTKKQHTWSHGLHDSHVHLDRSFVQHILRVSQESHGLSVYHQVPAGFYDILLPWLDLGDTWGIPVYHISDKPKVVATSIIRWQTPALWSPSSCSRSSSTAAPKLVPASIAPLACTVKNILDNWEISWNMLFGNFQKSIERLDSLDAWKIMREPCCNQNHPGNTLLSVWDPEQFTTHNNPQGLKVVAEKICETQLLKKIWILDCQLPTLALNKHPRQDPQYS